MNLLVIGGSLILAHFLYSGLQLYALVNKWKKFDAWSNQTRDALISRLECTMATHKEYPSTAHRLKQTFVNYCGEILKDIDQQVDEQYLEDRILKDDTLFLLSIMANWEKMDSRMLLNDKEYKKSFIKDSIKHSTNFMKILTSMLSLDEGPVIDDLNIRPEPISEESADMVKQAALKAPPAGGVLLLAVVLGDEDILVQLIEKFPILLAEQKTILFELLDGNMEAFPARKEKLLKSIPVMLVNFGGVQTLIPTFVVRFIRSQKNTSSSGIFV